jgi:hypothetical protein
VQAGILAADKVLTVSPNYASEISANAEKGVELDKYIRWVLWGHMGTSAFEVGRMAAQDSSCAHALRQAGHSTWVEGCFGYGDASLADRGVLCWVMC